MNNIDVDTLSGRDLDEAIALENGWHYEDINTEDGVIKCLIQYVENHDIWRKVYCRIWEQYEIEGDLPYYSKDIAAAWELDGDGWEWGGDDVVFSNHREIYPGHKVMEVSVYIGNKSFNGFAPWDTLADKAAAYATARCRAWLKAKYAEKNNEK